MIESERVGIERVRDIQFAVERSEDAVFIGHAWVKDEVSGLVFGCVEEGKDWRELRANLHRMLDDITEYAQDESGKDPRMVGGGWDFKNPPARGPVGDLRGA
jgi:hypothetical protein